MKKILLETIAQSERRLTPIILGQIVSKKYGFDHRRVKAGIKALVTSGDLIYTYRFGCTFLEPSLGKPTRVSRRVILKPPDMSHEAKPGDIVIALKHGAAFGSGRHPSTRLAVQAIEHLHDRTGGFPKGHHTRILDIGTGSGILILTAVLFGIDSGIGVDIDPCAIVEAGENIAINGLAKRITVDRIPLESISRSFFMVTANLRFPSLVNYSDVIGQQTVPAGFAVLSGIKTDELDKLIDVYTAKNFTCVWKRAEKDWAAVALNKNGK